MNERKRIQIVRTQVFARDGVCRAGRNLLAALGPCTGVAEWAHLGSHRRFKTRKMAPEVRHTTGGTCMLCSFHHKLYDGQILGLNRMLIEFLTEKEADGPMAFTVNGRRFEEPHAG